MSPTLAILATTDSEIDTLLAVELDFIRLLKIDPNRIVVTGGSAGGYLTLVTGYRVNPRPRALVAFWGYGDLVGDWYSRPSPHARHHTAKLTREEAFKQVSGPPVSDSRDQCRTSSK